MLTKLMFFLTAISPLASYGISTFSSSSSVEIWMDRIVGPARKGGSDKFILKAQYSDSSNTTTLNVYPYIYVTNGIHNIEYVEHLEDYGTLYKGQTLSWEFTFSYDDFENASKYNVTIYLYEKGSKNIVTQSPTITFYTSGGIHNMKNSVEPNSLYFCYSSLDENFYENEYYNFSKLSGGLSPNSSNELDYEDNFMYNPGSLGSYDESLFTNAYIAVVDNANLYPNVEKDLGDNMFSIAVDIDRPGTSDNMSLKLSQIDGDELYVDRSSLEMYSGAMPLSGNYQKATHFYIPRGKQEEAANNEYILVFEDVGYNKATLYKYLTYYSSKEHFGANCVSSEYCVIGSRSND